jgi:hypothetical protein
VFVESVGGWVSETESAKLTASDGAAEDELGFSVALSGKTVVACAPFAFFGPGGRTRWGVTRPLSGLRLWRPARTLGAARIHITYRCV